MKQLSPDQTVFLDETEKKVKLFQTNVGYDPAFSLRNHLHYGFSLEDGKQNSEIQVAVYDKTYTLYKGNQTIIKEFSTYQKCFDAVKKIVVQKLNAGYSFIPKDKFIPNRG